ncbi:MAG: radical SAM protein [Candidatus Omnitrophica bacterium]|nr:radical SAM protein [Candidatus Omnitrophota bacterium]
MKKIILFQTDVGYFDDVLSKPDLPLGLLAVASGLVDKFDVSIIDARRNRQWKKILLKELSSANVICVGVTVMLGESINQGKTVSAIVKEYLKDIVVVWGGTQSTLSSDLVLKEKNVDVVVRGEGERPFALLAEAVSSKTTYSKIPSISYKANGSIVHNPLSELADLKNLPELPYHLIDIRGYMPKMGRRRSLNYESSRGCPVGCPFCYNTLLAGRTWRGKKSSTVVDDLVNLRNLYGVEHIYFVDDNLFCDLNRLRDIALGLIKAECAITWDTQGACLDDVYKLREKDLIILKQSGLVRLAIGVQTASGRIRRLIKSGLTDEMIHSVNKKLKKFKVNPHYYFMMGFPGETDQERSDTIGLALKLIADNRDATTSSFSCYAPWPGTELFSFCEEKFGLKKPETIDYWIKEWDYSDVPWLSERQKVLLHRIFLISMLYDKKAQWYSGSFFTRLIAAIYRPLALFRLKHRFFSFFIEERLIEFGKTCLKFRLLK